MGDGMGAYYGTLARKSLLPGQAPISHARITASRQGNSSLTAQQISSPTTRETRSSVSQVLSPLGEDAASLAAVVDPLQSVPPSANRSAGSNSSTNSDADSVRLPDRHASLSSDRHHDGSDTTSVVSPGRSPDSRRTSASDQGTPIQRSRANSESSITSRSLHHVPPQDSSPSVVSEGNGVERQADEGELDLDLDLPESDQSGRGHAGATYQASGVDVPTLLSRWKRLQSGMHAGDRSSLGEGPELVDESNLSQLPDDAEETVEINEKTVAAFYETNNADLVKHYTENLVPDPKRRALLVQGYMSARSADKLADLKPTKDELEGLLGYVARAATAYTEADFDKQITASIKEWCGSFQQRANLSRVILQAETLLGDPDGTGIALKSLSSYEGDGVMAATRPEERASIRSEVESMLANAAKSRNPNAERALAVYRRHYYATDRAMFLRQIKQDIGVFVHDPKIIREIMPSISTPPEANGGGAPTDQLAMLEQIIQKLPDSGLDLTKAAASIETREDFCRILRSALGKIPQGISALDGDETASVQSGDALSIASATSTTQGTLTEAQQQTSVDPKKPPAPGPTVQQANTQAPAPAAPPPPSEVIGHTRGMLNDWGQDWAGSGVLGKIGLILKALLLSWYYLPKFLGSVLVDLVQGGLSRLTGNP